MADRMAAEIWIGGKLPRSLLDEFPISDLRLDWDNARLAASDEADMDSHPARADFPGAWKIFAVPVLTCGGPRQTSACREAAQNGPPTGNAGASKYNYTFLAEI